MPAAVCTRFNSTLPDLTERGGLKATLQVVHLANFAALEQADTTRPIRPARPAGRLSRSSLVVWLGRFLFGLSELWFGS